MANRFNNQQTIDIGTALTKIYETDATTVSTVIGINVANKTSNTIYADIVMQGADSTQTYLVKGVVIPKGQSLAAMGGDQNLVMVDTATGEVVASAEDESDTNNLISIAVINAIAFDITL
jgi:hypothetical protein